jgi:hypothetical protein
VFKENGGSEVVITTSMLEQREFYGHLLVCAQKRIEMSSTVGCIKEATRNFIIISTFLFVFVLFSEQK